MTVSEQLKTPHEPEYLWGNNLLNAIKKSRVNREPLIEGILFRKSAHMKFAPSGLGKSLLSLQEAVQGTITCNKVYGEYLVPKAFNTLYLQMERPEDENLERLKIMMEHTAFDPNRFVLNTSFQEFNFANPMHLAEAMLRAKKIVKSTFGIADLVKLDPIYPMVRGGVKDDEAASHVLEFSKLLQYHLGCSVDMIHHTNRGIRDLDGNRVGKDMFGSGSFEWHCTGIYSITKTSDGTKFKLEKTTQSNMEKSIDLVFNAESQLSFVRNSQGKLNKTDVLMNYLRACKAQQKTFTFAQMEEISGVSTSYLRGLYGGHLKNSLKICGKSPTGAHLYQYLGD